MRNRAASAWRSSCLHICSVVNLPTLGGIDGMSEVSGNDDVGTVFRFFCRILRLEMLQLRRDDRPHHCQQPPKEFGGTRDRDRCCSLSRDIVGFVILAWNVGQMSGVCFCIALSLRTLFTKTPASISSRIQRGPRNCALSPLKDL